MMKRNLTNSPGLEIRQPMDGVVFQRAFPREAPGHRRHIHEDYAITLIREGAVEVFLNGTTRLIPPWSLLCVNPGEPHAHRSLETKGYRHDSLFIDPAVLHAYRPGSSFSCFTEAVLDSVDLTARFARLADGIGRKVFGALESECLIGEFLDTLLVRQGGRQPEVRETNPKNAIARAKAFIHEHYHQEIVIEEIASHLNLSKYHFQRMFKKATAIPVHQYLVAWRIEKAKQALRRGESLIGTAHDCGFYDQSHFTRCFKALMGVTPGYYRGFFA